MPSANFLHLTDHLARGAVNFAADSFKVLLVSTLPDETALDTWINRSQLTGEASGLGYTPGGVAVTLTVGAVDAANNRIPITVANLSPGWVGTIAAVGAVIYKSTGSAATDKLITLVDFGGTVQSTAADFAVVFSTPIYINR